jgi:hypothetical protein
MTDRPNRSQKTRTPLGTRNVLSFRDLDPKYTYRVINDVDDRLARAQEAGYEFVESKESLGDPKAAQASKVGSHVSKPVGGGRVGYLMRIPNEFYEEDQKAKADKLLETERAMKPNKTKDEYGPGLTNE